MAAGEGGQGDFRISNKDELEEFFRKLSFDNHSVLAARIAARVLPFVGRVEDPELLRRSILASFRAVIVAQPDWARATIIRSAAADAANSISTSISTYGSYIAASALKAAAYAAAAEADKTMIAAAATQAKLVANSTAKDCQFLYVDQVSFKPLWYGGVPLEIKLECSEFQGKLKELGEPWLLIYYWYDQILRDAAIDPFPLKTLTDIVNETPKFWGDGEDNSRSPDIIMAEIAERLGWTGAKDAPLSEPISDPQSGSPTASSQYKRLTQIITSHSNDILQTLDGLTRLVQMERDKVASTLPNSEDAKREQDVQVQWFDQVLLGLEDIKASLESAAPEETAAKINTVSQHLGSWYEGQEKWVQKSIRMTAVGSTAIGLFSLGGLPAWLSLAVPSMFFAKKEIEDIRDIVKKD